MATITVTELQCIRKQDVSGKDEPIIFLAGQEVWEGKMGKGDTDSVNRSERFENTILLELKERDGARKDKLLKSWVVTDRPTDGVQRRTASASGYHYELSYRVR